MTHFEEFPSGQPLGESGEPDRQPLALESRFPALVMPDDAMWPMRIHDDAVRAAASEALPQLVATLAQPIESASLDQVAAIFEDNPHERQGWTFREGQDGNYTFSTRPFEIREPGGGGRLFSGINYTFDRNGRVTRIEFIEGDWSYDKGRPSFQEHFTYDEQGYLALRTVWQKYNTPYTDRFEYTADAAGTRTPVHMTRTLGGRSDRGSEQGEPMTVDLANYEEWLATNPNGFSRVTKDELAPLPLDVSDFSVVEQRRGILFAHPEQLEHALVVFGSGNYFQGNATVDHNIKAFTESQGDLAGQLFAAVMSAPDMGEFVQRRIMGEIREKWRNVEKSRHDDASERAYFSFDYDGPGGFHKSNVEVTMTKGGIELHLSAAYVGDQVEDNLASFLHQPRGLRSAGIDIPINQTAREGYFLVDLQAACQKLGITVSDQDLQRYISQYVGDESELAKPRYQRENGGEQGPLWTDAELLEREGIEVSVSLVTEKIDYEANADLDTYFAHDGTSVWGPLPKEVRGSRKDSTPRLKLTIKPVQDHVVDRDRRGRPTRTLANNPFDPALTERTNEIVRGYMDRLAA